VIYRERGLFVQTLHPAVICAYAAGVSVLALALSHPLYLAALLAVCLLTLVHLRALAAAGKLLVFVLPVVLLLVVVNPLVSPAGVTVLWHGPAVPWLGNTFNLTLEALGYAAGMGLRLLTVLAVFLVYSAALNPDRVFHLFTRCAPRTAVILLLALRLYPATVRDYRRIREAQTARGVDFESGPASARFRNGLGIVQVMLVTALERAFDLAECLQARGFGSGPRSVYAAEYWRPRDGLVLAGLMAAVAAGFSALVSGTAAYDYYPAADPLFRREAVVSLAAVGLGLSLPVLLQWGWGRWSWLRSKI